MRENDKWNNKGQKESPDIGLAPPPRAPESTCPSRPRALKESRGNELLPRRSRWRPLATRQKRKWDKNTKEEEEEGSGSITEKLTFIWEMGHKHTKKVENGKYVYKLSVCLISLCLDACLFVSLCACPCLRVWMPAQVSQEARVGFSLKEESCCLLFLRDV